MNAELTKTHLRQRMDIIELLAFFNIRFDVATEKQLFNAKLFIQTLQLANIKFDKIKLMLFNLVERVPNYVDLNLEALMSLKLPVTELDTTD